MRGEKCSFRHEARSFTKIHRHFYMPHCQAMPFYAAEILEYAKSHKDTEDDTWKD
jgi:hypothetical protein